MRRHFLAGAAALLLSGPATAQWIVHDPASNLQRITEAVRSITQMQAQLRQLESTYNAISHSTDLGGIAGALGGVSRRYFPEAAQSLSMVSRLSNGGLSGAWGEAQRFTNSNRAYQSPHRDRWQEEMERRESVTANAQSIAAAGMMDAEDRLMKLEALKARAEAAQDGTEVNAVQALIAIEQQNLSAHRGNLETVHMMLVAEDRVITQRAEQRQREGADQLRANTAPITDDLR